MSEMPSCYTLKKRIARKHHKCCECHGVIRKGEEYNHHSGVWDGEPAAFKVCFDCDSLRKEFACEHYLLGDEWPAFTCLGEDISYSGDDDFMDKFAAIREARREIKI